MNPGALAVAEAAFATIAGRFPHLETVRHPDDPVELSVTIPAQPGVSQELWLALQKDVHLQQQLLMEADAVVIGMGSADSLSVAVPRWVMMALPYLRPKGLRREVRRRIAHLHPSLTRVTGGVMRYTPPDVISHAFTKSVDAVRLFAGPEVPLVAVLPPWHRTVYYGGLTTHHERVHALLGRLAAEKGVDVVDLAALTRHRLDELNVDGAHWGWDIHRDVGTAMARSLAAQL